MLVGRRHGHANELEKDAATKRRIASASYHRHLGRFIHHLGASKAQSLVQPYRRRVIGCHFMVHAMQTRFAKTQRGVSQQHPPESTATMQSADPQVLYRTPIVAL